MQEVAEVQGLVQEAAQEAPAAPPVVLPVCPYCGEDPLKLSLMFQVFPKGQIASLAFCGNPACRKTLTVQIVGQEQQGRIVHPDKPRIV
jgi:hypothetical protein